jgi:hypothetical protein
VPEPADVEHEPIEPRLYLVRLARPKALDRWLIPYFDRVRPRKFAQAVKQVQEWLGHHKASFTLDTYTHLMSGGVGGPLILPTGGSAGAVGGQRNAPKSPEPDRNAGSK